MAGQQRAGGQNDWSSRREQRYSSMRQRREDDQKRWAQMMNIINSASPQTMAGYAIGTALHDPFQNWLQGLFGGGSKSSGTNTADNRTNGGNVLPPDDVRRYAEANRDKFVYRDANGNIGGSVADLTADGSGLLGKGFVVKRDEPGGVTTAAVLDAVPKDGFSLGDNAQRLAEIANYGNLLNATQGRNPLDISNLLDWRW